MYRGTQPTLDLRVSGGDVALKSTKQQRTSLKIYSLRPNTESTKEFVLIEMSKNLHLLKDSFTDCLN